MKSVKAILAGSVFIIITLLFVQLVLIFVAVGYQALAVDYPFLNEITLLFRYLLGIPIFLAVMFFGGYITTLVAEVQTTSGVLIHCFIVGLSTVGVMMYSALSYSALTLTGIIFILLSLIGCVIGGFYQMKSANSMSSE